MLTPCVQMAAVYTAMAVMRAINRRTSVTHRALCGAWMKHIRGHIDTVDANTTSTAVRKILLENLHEMQSE